MHGRQIPDDAGDGSGRRCELSHDQTTDLQRKIAPGHIAVGDSKSSSRVADLCAPSQHHPPARAFHEPMGTVASLFFTVSALSG